MGRFARFAGSGQIRKGCGETGTLQYRGVANIIEGIA